MRHGTEIGYRLHKCRCPQCYGIVRRNEFLRRTGRAGLVPIDRVADLFERLHRAGWSYTDIGAVALLDTAKVSKYRRRVVKRIRMSTERRILSADYACQVPGTRVDGNGTRLRLRALARIGWTPPALAQMCGVPASTLASIRGKDGTGTTAATRDTVRDLFDTLALTPGPSSIAAVRARKAGWPLPLALDEDRLDDPGYQPSDEWVRTEWTNGRRRIHPDDVRDLLEMGHSEEWIAERMGTEPTYLRKLLRRQEAS